MVKHDSKIIAITEFLVENDVVIDAINLVVASGFINLHGHGVAVGGARTYAMKGVTTTLELVSGLLPIDDCYETQAEQLMLINFGASAA